MSTTKNVAVYAAKTNDRLPGVASAKLIEACAANPEGKALASLDRHARAEDGGIWYPVQESWGHDDAVIVFTEAVIKTPATVCPPSDAVGPAIYLDSAGREYDRHPAQTASDIARRNYSGTGYVALYVSGRAYVHHYRGWIAAPSFIPAAP